MMRFDDDCAMRTSRKRLCHFDDDRNGRSQYTDTCVEGRRIYPLHSSADLLFKLTLRARVCTLTQVAASEVFTLNCAV